MAQIISSYEDLSASSSSPALVSQALQAIITASPFAFNGTQREELIILLLNDIRAAFANQPVRIPVPSLSHALLALKILCRTNEGSRVILSEPESNFLLFLSIASDTSASNAESSKEALRIVANALLLIDWARPKWIAIGGGELCVSILDNTHSSPEYTFLASRILFLTTLSQSPFLRKTVDQLHIVDSICNKLDTLLPQNAPSSKEALVDLLKVMFNLMIQYPRMVEEENGDGNSTPNGKVMDDLWSDKFAPFLPPLLRLLSALPITTPPLQPPLTHVLHALLNVPIKPYKSIWFPSSKNPSPTHSPRSSSEQQSQRPTRSATSETFHKALSLISLSSSSSQHPHGHPRSKSRSSTPTSPTPPTPPSGVVFDPLRRLYQLLDAALAHYVPNDPDDVSVRKLCAREGIKLDDIVCPPILLLVRLVKGDENAKKTVKEWILPADLDRSTALEKRDDLLGRSIRLLTSVYFPRLKDSIGELLFVICDSDASTFATQVGYGNAAGFLFNKGILSAPGGSNGQGGIDLITGKTRKDVDDDPDFPPMTEEEKEREAEKLFVLFDRLERMGMGPSPLRKAQQEGKLEEVPKAGEKDKEDSD